MIVPLYLYLWDHILNTVFGFGSLAEMCSEKSIKAGERSREQDVWGAGEGTSVV